MFHATSHSPALGPGCAGPALALPCAPLPPADAPRGLQPSTGGDAFAVDPSDLPGSRQHTDTPYVTGTSVLGLKYSEGVLIAADTLGSYGSTKRYKDFSRVRAVGDRVVLGASGELSDFQHILTLLEELLGEEWCEDPGSRLGPREVWAYLTRVLYNRRNKMDPLWNSLVVGGTEEDGTAFLGLVGMIGVHLEDDHLATGFGQQLARPLFRERHRLDMTEEEATGLLKEALKVCYYRDKQTMNKFQIAKVTAAGVTVSEPFALETEWGLRAFARPASFAPGTW